MVRSLQRCCYPARGRESYLGRTREGGTTGPVETLESDAYQATNRKVETPGQRTAYQHCGGTQVIAYTNHCPELQVESCLSTWRRERKAI